MREQAQIIRFTKQEAPFVCPACGADRGCDCNAPAIEKLAHKVEQQRRNQKAYRERRAAAALYNAPAENTGESEANPLELRSAAPLRHTREPQKPIDRELADAHSLIGLLGDSSAETRSAVVQQLVSGSRQSEFKAVTEAVADLYQQLSKAGR